MALTLHLRSSRNAGPELDEAAALIRAGGIVVFPTETVYGIGAGLDRLDAVARVNELKGRPVGMPLLIHCAGLPELSTLARTIPANAFPLFEAFLPGPLAVVLAASDLVPEALRGPGGTVGIRVVHHPAARELIRRAGIPITGSSANRHGSKATAEFSALDAGITAGADLVLDAGRCGSGLASTVVDLTASPPRILRAGSITREQLEAVSGTSWER
ncbi:MAG: L-threonylcarbamoyladenylate synthase [bacterium]